MKLLLVCVTPRRRATPLSALADTYLDRLRGYVPAESRTVSRQEDVLAAPGTGRVAPRTVLLESRGKTLSSEELAAWIGRERDAGVQSLVFAIGPADGWSAEARQRADLLLSFGPMTFPHELARVMLTEQLYRAFTILAGHPYHTGH